MNYPTKYVCVLKIILLPVLLPVAMLYALFSFIRNSFFDLQIFSSNQLAHTKIISVGNITVGGTGKTPLTALIVDGLLQKGLKVGIISRGYGGNYQNISPVDLKQIEPAKMFGDEPTWFKKQFSQIPVWVGADKSATATSLTRAANVDVIVADDAFQHRRLKRDLDIVVIDASASVLDYLPIPLGRGREDFLLGLRRAEFVVLNKVNFVSIKKAEKIRAKLEFLKAGKTKIFNVETHIDHFSFLKSSLPIGNDLLEGKNLFLASTIARPEQFLNLLNSSIRANVVGHLQLSDHAVYTPEIIKRLETMARAARAHYIVVTEKDAVKLSKVELSLPIVVSHLKLSAPEFVDAVFSRIIR